jgi:two-component system chemotaxis response regulator CheY
MAPFELREGDCNMVNSDMKILAVDDFSTMRRIIRNLLRQLGYLNILEAEDGVQALAILKKDKVDLVISDWNMPNMNGLELLKEMRRDEQLKHIPLLMVTAEAIKEKVIEAVKAGVNNYIVKPFTAEILKEKIDEVFSQ